MKLKVNLKVAVVLSGEEAGILQHVAERQARFLRGEAGNPIVTTADRTLNARVAEVCEDFDKTLGRMQELQEKVQEFQKGESE